MLPLGHVVVEGRMECRCHPNSLCWRHPSALVQLHLAERNSAITRVTRACMARGSCDRVRDTRLDTAGISSAWLPGDDLLRDKY